MNPEAAMTHAECVAAVREIVAEHHEPADATSSLELDSLEVVLVVEALEDRLGIRIAAKDLLPEHFGSLEALVRLVEHKLA